MSFLDDFKKTNLQRQSDADAIQTNIRAGIGTTYIDFAIVDNATSLVATTIVGYADTSKNPTCAERLSTMEAHSGPRIFKASFEAKCLLWSTCAWWTHRSK